MSRCILFGHRPVTQPCVGKYAGHEITTCGECGILVDETGKSLGIPINEHLSPDQIKAVLRRVSEAP